MPSSISKHLQDLTTPCLLLERDKLQQNIERANTAASRLGVKLRPHMKTAKCYEIARLVLGSNWTSAAVSSLPELEMLMDMGVKDIRYTSPFDPAKVASLKPYFKRGLKLEVLIDDTEAAKRLSEAATKSRETVGVVVELDTDGNRSGVPPEKAPELVKRISHELSGLMFGGIYSFAGGTYRKSVPDDRTTLIKRHVRALRSVSEDLRADGFTCPHVGIGASPALLSADDFSGLTEACAGVYMFQDLAQVGTGTAQLSDLAVSVLATVVQHKPDLGRIFIDAGGLALSQDRSTATQAVDQGYGLVCDADTGQPIGDGTLIVAKTSQEHGLIQKRDGQPAPPDWLPIGKKVRIYPNHVCMMAAAHSYYHLVSTNGFISQVWHRVSGWELSSNQPQFNAM